MAVSSLHDLALIHAQFQAHLQGLHADAQHCLKPEN